MLTRALMDSHYGKPKVIARSRATRTSPDQPANPILRTAEMQMTAGFAALIRSRLRNPG